MLRSLATATLLTLLLPSAAKSQACVGLPGGSHAHVNATAAYFTNGDAEEVTGRLGFVGSRAYGGASVSFFPSLDDVASSVGFSGDAGLILPVGKTVQACPRTAFGYRYGPNYPSASSFGLSASAGLSLGTEIRAGEQVSLVPFAGASLVATREQFSIDEPLNISGSSNDFGGTGTLGLGLMFSRSLLIAPSISIPVGFEGAKSYIGVRASVSLGH